MATGYISPIGLILQAFTDQGVVLAGGKVWTYTAGTTTPVTTYTDSTLVTPNANPIILQSNGRLPASIWTGTTVVLKMVLQDSTGAVIVGGTVDNLPAINDVNFSTIITLVVSGTATIAGTTTLNGALVANAGATITGATTITGALTLNGGAATPDVPVTFSATAMTVNCALSNVFKTVFTANVSVAPTLSNPADGQTINWFITQDAVGSRTMMWPTSFKWPNGVVGVLSTPVNSVDLLTATYRSDTGFWYTALSKAFA